jgi:hypothetical protein
MKQHSISRTDNQLYEIYSDYTQNIRRILIFIATGLAKNYLMG